MASHNEGLRLPRVPSPVGLAAGSPGRSLPGSNSGIQAGSAVRRRERTASGGLPPALQRRRGEVTRWLSAQPVGQDRGLSRHEGLEMT